MPAPAKRKNPAAVALGRKGGKKGGLARAANLTPAQRSASARKAVQARWAKSKAKTRAGHPVKTDATLPAGDTSDRAFLSLLKRYKATHQPHEMQALSEQIERMIFHKQFANAQKG
jgi:hypothetical protein